MKGFSGVRLFTRVALQTPLSMGFPRQEYWSGLPFPLPRGLPDPGTESGSPALQADSLPSESQGKPILTIKLFKAYMPNVFKLCKLSSLHFFQGLFIHPFIHQIFSARLCWAIHKPSPLSKTDMKLYTGSTKPATYQ